MSDNPIIVFTRNGKTSTVTGWRAWLLVLAAYLFAAFSVVVLALLFMSIAITLATVLLFAVPLAIAFAVVTSWMRSRDKW